MKTTDSTESSCMPKVLTGLTMAAKQLTSTAEDFESIVDQIDQKATRTPMEMTSRRMLVEKAALLRGQAKIILELV